MACLLTSGRTEPCRDAVGGLKNLYLIDYRQDVFTVLAGEVTAIDIGVTNAYKYELHGNGNNLTENFNTDDNAGTSTVEQVLTLVLKKQTKESAVEIGLLLKGRPIAVVEDRMGNFKVIGIEYGTVVTGDAQSGGAMEEFNGYNLTLTAKETSPAPYLDSATQTALLALVSATNVTP